MLKKVVDNTPRLLEGEDVHKIALAMTNLTEYLNSKYIKDEDFDKEVIRVTKTLYDPLVEEQGIAKGIEQGIEQGLERAARKMILKEKSDEEIMEVTDLPREVIEKLRREING